MCYKQGFIFKPNFLIGHGLGYKEKIQYRSVFDQILNFKCSDVVVGLTIDAVIKYSHSEIIDE